MNLQELFASMEAHLRSVGYAESTIQSIKYSWNQFALYCKRKGIVNFDFSVAADFAKEHYGIDFYQNEIPHSQQECHIFRVFKSLDELQSGLPITANRKRPKVAIPSTFIEIIQPYLEEYGCKVKKSSLDDAEYTLRKFSEYLIKCGIENLDQIDMPDITGFRETLKDYAATTQNSWMSRIKDFLVYAYANKYTKRNLSYLVTKRKYEPSVKPPSLYSKDEIERLLASVDRNNPVGKRDYAILILAARLGIRSGDIVNLQFENFLWEKNEIHFVQQKTGQMQTLPLPNDVGEAIIEYLRNGRPVSEEKYIFLKANAPYTALNASTLHPIMKKYAQRAHLKNDPPRKFGLHAFRHSLASNLLNKAIPLPIISEILGHQKTETTTVYAKVDTNSLRKCALDLPTIMKVGDDNA